MACCALALAFVYQLVDAWCRLRERVGGGLAPLLGATRAVRLTGGWRPRLPAIPRNRTLLWLAFALEFAALGALAHEHGHHLRSEAAHLVSKTTTLASDLCRGVPALLPTSNPSEE